MVRYGCDNDNNFWISYEHGYFLVWVSSGTYCENDNNINSYFLTIEKLIIFKITLLLKENLNLINKKIFKVIKWI